MNLVLRRVACLLGGISKSRWKFNGSNLHVDVEQEKALYDEAVHTSLFRPAASAV